MTHCRHLNINFCRLRKESIVEMLNGLVNLVSFQITGIRDVDDAVCSSPVIFIPEYECAFEFL
jgi:hypothetical protein